MSELKEQMMTSTLTEVSIEISPVIKRKQVGLLGGNFNPVHYAHLMMIDQVYHQLDLDEVFLMPTNQPPHKVKKMTIDSHHRLEMLKRATENYQNIGIEPIELQHENKSYTYDTMKRLTEKNPETDYYFIIGGDMVKDLPNWYKIDQLLSLVQFVGIERPDFPKESPYPIIWVDVPQSTVSSSLIRKRVKAGCSVNFMLPPSVLSYIQKEGLYLE